MRTVPSMTDAGTEAILKQSQVEKKKLSHVESQTSLHLSSFKASMIESKPVPVEMNESLQTVMDQIHMWRAVELLQSKSSLKDKFASTLLTEKMSVIDEESDVRSKLFSSGHTASKFGLSPNAFSSKRKTDGPTDFCTNVRTLTVNLEDDFLRGTCESPRAIASEVTGKLNGT